MIGVIIDQNLQYWPDSAIITNPGVSVTRGTVPSPFTGYAWGDLVAGSPDTVSEHVVLNPALGLNTTGTPLERLLYPAEVQVSKFSSPVWPDLATLQEGAGPTEGLYIESTGVVHTGVQTNLGTQAAPTRTYTLTKGGNEIGWGFLVVTDSTGLPASMEVATHWVIDPGFTIHGARIKEDAVASASSLQDFLDDKASLESAAGRDFLHAVESGTHSKAIPVVWRHTQ